VSSSAPSHLNTERRPAHTSRRLPAWRCPPVPRLLRRPKRPARKTRDYRPGRWQFVTQTIRGASALSHPDW
jgi:hypothetical protein